MATTPLVVPISSTPYVDPTDIAAMWWDSAVRYFDGFGSPAPPSNASKNSSGSLLDLIQTSTLPELIHNATSNGNLTDSQRTRYVTNGESLSTEELAKRQALANNPNVAGDKASALDDLFSSLPDFPLIDPSLVTDAENAALWGVSVFVVLMLIVVIAK